MKNAFACLILSGLVSSAFAQLRPNDDSAPNAAFGVVAESVDRNLSGGGADLGAALSFPLFDHPGDGALWVRGESYKARFDEHEIEFTPFLGSDAPRNFPLALALESASIGGREIGFATSVAPVQDGGRIVFDRGALDEVYLVRAGFLEQAFVLAERPGYGELVLRIRARTELAAAGDTGGIRFSGERGGVVYGRATVVDARARRFAAETRVADGVIEIRASSADLDSARFPLVVDPVIAVFWASDPASAATILNPDTAYDLDTDSWLCTFEQVYSQSDHDVMTRRSSGNGTFLDAVYVDFTSNNWTKPRVANNNGQNQFLVVAECNVGTSTNRISARTRSASSTAMGAQYNVVAGNSVVLYSSPDVGGDPYPWGSPAYCVAWTERQIHDQYPSNDTRRILCRLVTPAGTLLTVRELGNSFWDSTDAGFGSKVRVSKSNGAYAYGDQRWTVAWNQPVVWKTGVRQVTLSGQPLGSNPWEYWGHLYSVSPLLDGYGSSRQFLLAVQDIYAYPALGISLFSLSYDANGQQGPWSYAYIANTSTDASVETDGSRYFVAYSEQPSAYGYFQDVYLSTYGFDPYGALSLLESHVPLATSSQPEGAPSLASKHSSGSVSPLALCVWQRWSGIGHFPQPTGIFASLLY